MAKKRLVVQLSERPDCSKGSCCEGPLHQVFTPSEKLTLSGLVFRDAKLNLVDFSDADLSEAEFHNVLLSGADFSGADLRGASFIRCDLRNARFDSVVVDGTRFDNSWLIGARGLTEEMNEYVRRHGALLWFS